MYIPRTDFFFPPSFTSMYIHQPARYVRVDGLHPPQTQHVQKKSHLISILHLIFKIASFPYIFINDMTSILLSQVEILIILFTSPIPDVYNVFIQLSLSSFDFTFFISFLSVSFSVQTLLLPLFRRSSFFTWIVGIASTLCFSPLPLSVHSPHCSEFSFPLSFSIQNSGPKLLPCLASFSIPAVKTTSASGTSKQL